MRMRHLLGVLALWCSGCALPCLALHNIRVEMRDNLEDHMASLRGWRQGEPVAGGDGPGASVQEAKAGMPLDGIDVGSIAGPAVLLPSPTRDSVSSQSHGR